MQPQTRFDIHVCLVSEQNFPNLMPFFDNALRPQAVLLCVTDQMKPQADRLEKAITERYSAVKVERLRISDAFNIESTFNEISEWLDGKKVWLEENGCTIALNATCGTKPMSMAAVSVFDMFGAPVFYCDYSRVQLMNLAGLKSPVTIPLAITKWPVASYLTAYGFSSRSDIKPLEKLSDASIRYAAKIIQTPKSRDAVAVMNLVASSAHDRHSLKGGDASQYLRVPYFQQLVKNARQWVTLDENKHLKFADHESSFFMAGGWLEDYTAEICRRLPVHSVVKNLQILSSDHDVPNELDVVFIHRGQLHVIEVKTCILEAKDQNLLHKLSSLGRELGHTKLCLVSLRPLPENMMDRAEDLRITVIHDHDLSRLEDHLCKWIGVPAIPSPVSEVVQEKAGGSPEDSSPEDSSPEEEKQPEA